MNLSRKILTLGQYRQAVKDPLEKEIERKFAEEGLAPYRWSNGPGEVYPPHDHSYAKVLYCVRGGIQFRLEKKAKRIELKPGDRLDLPPHTIHSAVVGPEGVVCLEAHRP